MTIKERIKIILQKRTIHQAGYVYFGSLVNGASLFALNILLARSVSENIFGIFSISVLMLSTVAEMSDFGLNAGLLRFAPYYISTSQDDKLKQLVKTIWQWRVLLTAVLTFGGLAFSGLLAKYVFGQPQISQYLAFSALGIGGVILLGFLSTYLQAKQRFFYNASMQSLKGLLRLLVVIILLWLGVKNLFVFLSVYIFIPWILFIANYKVLPFGFRHVIVENEIKIKLNSQLAKFSFWLTISSLLSIFASRVDQIMVSRLMGLASVAVFSVAYQLIQFFPLIYSSVSSVLTPKISGLTDKALMITFVKRTFKWVFVLALIVSVFIYPSQYLITLFFGQKYVLSMPVYLILAYSLMLNILAIPFSLTVMVFNRTNLVAFSGVLQLVLSVFANMFFIPAFGIIGAAYAFGLGIAASLIYNMACAFYLIKKGNLIIA
jgi:O-antigen/teichoic acid export membrane protein